MNKKKCIFVFRIYTSVSGVAPFEWKKSIRNYKRRKLNFANFLSTNFIPFSFRFLDLSNLSSNPSTHTWNLFRTCERSIRSTKRETASKEKANKIHSNGENYYRDRSENHRLEKKKIDFPRTLSLVQWVY